jgi:hypothetical protein
MALKGKHPITGANWNDVFDKASRSAMEAIGAKLESDAARLAPRKTGRLSGSITHATVDGISSPSRESETQPSDFLQRKPRSVHEVWVGTNVEYAAHQEYGWEDSWGNPYLRPAFDDNRKAIVRLYAEQYDKVMSRGKF